MSRYEWEGGTIRLPAGEYSSFRRGLLTAWNEYQDWLFAAAEQAYKACKAAGKGKRKFDFNRWFEHDYAGHVDDVYAYHLARTHIGRLIFLDGKLVRPRKKLLTKLPISRDDHLMLGGASITLRKPYVAWHVPEQNHGVEEARRHPLAVRFFNLLATVKWTRGSGGKLVGNDEYNTDRDGAGEGANYVTATYPPASGSQQQAQTRSLASFSRWLP